MKNITVMLLVAIFAVWGMSNTAMAKKKKRKKAKAQSEMAYQASWGMAGCGLWAGIIKGKEKGSQLGVYALRNLVLNSQTSAITSGTSNCVHKGASYSQKEKEVFVTINLSSLEKEAAQGQGQYLNAFAEILGCSSHEAFANFSQSKYKEIFQSDKPNHVLKNYLNEVKKNETLNKQCVRIG